MLTRRQYVHPKHGIPDLRLHCQVLIALLASLIRPAFEAFLNLATVHMLILEPKSKSRSRTGSGVVKTFESMAAVPSMEVRILIHLPSFRDVCQCRFDTCAGEASTLDGCIC